MSQMRLNQLTGRWVTIVAERAQRPTERLDRFRDVGEQVLPRLAARVRHPQPATCVQRFGAPTSPNAENVRYTVIVPRTRGLVFFENFFSASN